MPGERALDGIDEPSRASDDHAELLSELDSHDLALAMDLVEAGDSDVLEVDTDGDPDEVFPQSVASGGPTPSGVILWARVSPDRFDTETPLGVEVAAYRVPEGVVNLQDVTDQYRGG